MTNNSYADVVAGNKIHIKQAEPMEKICLQSVHSNMILQYYKIIELLSD